MAAVGKEEGKREVTEMHTPRPRAHHLLLLLALAAGRWRAAPGDVHTMFLAASTSVSSFCGGDAPALFLASRLPTGRWNANKGEKGGNATIFQIRG